MRYRQVLGAYQRPGQQQPVQQAPARNRGTYVRVVDQSRRRHDGLYFRIAFGIGITHDSVKTDAPLPTDNMFTFTPGNLDVSGSGFAWMTEMALGFTPTPGLVLGIGSYTATVPKIKADSKDPHTGKYDERISQLALLGPVVDWYFFPKLGFHAEASPGLATYVAGASVPEVEGPFAQAHTAVGFGFMLGVGYDWWIGDQWSLGVLGRITYGATSGAAGSNFSHDSYAPAFLITATYH
jgi:hypothetical protein